jgi:hypothetical protein
MKKQMAEMREHHNQLKKLYQSADEATRNKMAGDFLSNWMHPQSCDLDGGQPVSQVSRPLLHGALVKLLIQYRKHLDGGDK